MVDSPRVDVSENRRTRKWTLGEQIGRTMWALAHPLFAWSPRPCWRWRAWLLRRFGARVGRHVHVCPNVMITIPWNLELEDQCAIGDRAILYALGPISIGQRATISQGAHLCAGTHDWRQPDMPLVKLPIRVGSDAWVCADAFLGPGVAVGQSAIVGARAVAMKDVAENAIVVGNPAIVVSTRVRPP